MAIGHQVKYSAGPVLLPSHRQPSVAVSCWYALIDHFLPQAWLDTYSYHGHPWMDTMDPVRFASLSRSLLLSLSGQAHLLELGPQCVENYTDWCSAQHKYHNHRAIHRQQAHQRGI